MSDFVKRKTTKNTFFRLKNGGEEKEISSQTFSFVFCQDWGLQQAGVVEILDDVDHATCLVSTNFFQVEMKPSSTPVLLAVRRRGEDVKGGDKQEEQELAMRRRRMEEEEERAFTSLPNQHKLRRQR